ncbi:MAG: hypothetical protein JXA71_17985, partial [Chitinispirillaceae bacterium]|nr:hypothetical protein [Chitinispirillaceae bacterium]
LERDGANEKYEKRVAEIEGVIGQSSGTSRTAQEPSQKAAPKPKRKSAGPPRGKAGRMKKPEAGSGSDRPLAGVRLKRRPKLQWRKKAGEKKAGDTKE